MRICHDHELGDIELIKNKRAKRINVRIKKDKLTVSIPPGNTEKDALDFIDSVRQKILEKQRKVRIKENVLLLEIDKPLNTQTFTVFLQKADRTNLFFSFADTALKIEIPRGINYKTDEIQQQCWNGITYFLKKEAKRVLPARTEKLAGEFGFTYSSVKIQSSKSRWGSCSRGKNINLSFYLMLLPAYLSDYVILHELCHTKEMNHSEKFWAWMDKVTDNKSKVLRAELKKYPIPG